MLKRDVGDNLKEVVAQSCGIRLDTTLKVGNEKGCNYGEQAGLFVQKIHQRRDQGGCGKSTHKDQCGAHVFFVFLCKVTVILVCFTLELIVEPGAGAADFSNEIWKTRW